MREYFIEDRKNIELSRLTASFMPEKNYRNSHECLPIMCHDVFIQYMGGILLVIRDNFPMKGELWPIGGRVERGVKTEESLKRRAKKECNLDLYGFHYLGSARVFTRTDPFGHGRGTDNPAFVYFARGKGKLKLDCLHKSPLIVVPSDYSSIEQKLHPYVKDWISEAFKLMQ